MGMIDGMDSEGNVCMVEVTVTIFMGFKRKYIVC